MRHAHPRVAGRNIDVGLVPRVTAEEGEPVNSLHDLARPAKRDLLHHGEPLPRPCFEPAILLRLVVGLAGLGILAPDDQKVLTSPRSAHPTGPLVPGD